MVSNLIRSLELKSSSQRVERAAKKYGLSRYLYWEGKYI